MHCIAGKEVLAPAGRSGPGTNRHEVEDRPDVAEEGVVPLAGERQLAVREDVRLVGSVLRVRHAAERLGTDVVRRGQETLADDAGDSRFGFRNAVRLLRVLQERDVRAVREPIRVRRVRHGIAVLVDVDVVAGVLREGPVVRTGRRILAGNPVRDDRDGVRLVGRPERVQIRVIRCRIFRDQRCLPVTRRVAGAGSRARDHRNADSREERAGEAECEQELPLHSHHSFRAPSARW